MLRPQKLRVRRDLTEDKGPFRDTIPAECASHRKVILRTISEDVLMKSQDTEPDCEMISLASSRVSISASIDKCSRLQSGSDVMEIDEYSQSSIDAWAAACRNEADAAIVFAELQEERAEVAAALAKKALIKANELAFAAEEARKKATTACKMANSAKISAEKAADFALKSVQAAAKAEETAFEFRSLQTW